MAKGLAVKASPANRPRKAFAVLTLADGIGGVLGGVVGTYEAGVRGALVLVSMIILILLL